MTPIEQNTHVFVVRIWSEAREVEGAAPTWRGVIEHIPSGERRYVQNLDDITIFMAAYLVKMGMKLTLCWQIKRWLNQRKQPGQAQIKADNEIHGS
jgi:hypothetical protein